MARFTNPAPRADDPPTRHSPPERALLTAPVGAVS